LKLDFFLCLIRLSIMLRCFICFKLNKVENCEG
jgi:hypothetical protein